MIEESESKPDRPNQIDKRSDRPANSDIGPKLEHPRLESDRTTVLRQIDQVRSAIDQNGKELGMVAVEGVFEAHLSEELLSSSRALRTIAQELKRLHRMVTRAGGYPKRKK